MSRKGAGVNWHVRKKGCVWDHEARKCRYCDQKDLDCVPYVSKQGFRSDLLPSCTLMASSTRQAYIPPRDTTLGTRIHKGHDDRLDDLHSFVPFVQEYSKVLDVCMIVKSTVVKNHHKT